MLHPAILRLTVIGALACTVWAVHGAAGRLFHQQPAGVSVAAALAAAPSASDQAADTRATIRFLERKLASDTGDANAYDRLAGAHLQLLRETGSIDDLQIALRAARASLASVPAVRNVNGLAALALAEFASHDFERARVHALQLAKLDPAKGYPYAILGDADAELGDYAAAARTYAQMTRRDGGITTNGESRLARFALLHGDLAGSERRLGNALALAARSSPAPRETIAWCQWQLGETAFAQGRYADAEARDRDALATYPNYFRALASLGRVRAARGDLGEAAERYEEAIRRFPDPAFVAALGDVYAAAGRKSDAAAQYALVDAIGHLSTINGVLYNRQLALFHADHDVQANAAYANAKREYAVRRDVFGADALAWTALKAGRIGEARAVMRDALRLGTRDAKLLFHAGIIARAAGDDGAARDGLQRALALSPQFDPLQAPRARAVLAQLGTSS